MAGNEPFKAVCIILFEISTILTHFSPFIEYINHSHVIRFVELGKYILLVFHMIQVIKRVVMFHLLMTSSISAIERKLAGTVITLLDSTSWK